MVGLLLGLAASGFIWRWLHGMLFEVELMNPLLIVLTAISLLLVCLVASLIPSSRAARTSPWDAIRMP